MNKTASILITVLATASAGAAAAESARGPRTVIPPKTVVPVDVSGGASPRGHRARAIVSNPDWPTPAWDRFQTAVGGSWQALWDPETRVPVTVFGSGIDAPGAVDSAQLAVDHSMEQLRRHLPLLAPGSRVGDFAVLDNRVVRGMRSVALQQYHRGMPVRGGTVLFTFKRDRLIAVSSTAWPDIDVPIPAVPVAESLAEERARAWVADERGSALVVGIQSPEVVALVRTGDRPATIEYTSAMVVDVVEQSVESGQSRGRWRVYVDMATGARVMGESLVHGGTGQLLYNTPDRWPGGTRSDRPATYVETTVDAEFALTDEAGEVTWPDTGSPVELFARPRGRYFWVEDASGADPVFQSFIDDGGSVVWDAASDEDVDAMLTTFVHLGIARERALAIDSTPGWLGENLIVEVNADAPCGAFYDRGSRSLHFARRGMNGAVQCANTGRLPDLIYHEFGHILHHRSQIAGLIHLAVGEGAGDYFAATITGDPAFGVGLYENPDPVRHIDPPDREYAWPDDAELLDPYATGRIFSGAMWDLRTELSAELGPEAGVAHADRLFHGALMRASDIPSTYAYVLAEDDDDGDLANGTPNQCAIDRAFGRHGLALGEFSSSVVVNGPYHDGLNVYFTTTEPSAGQCPVNGIASAVIDWNVRGDPGTSGSRAMGLGEGSLSAGLPIVGDNLVLQYRITVEYQNGSRLEFPENPADPHYEVFLGDVVELYCTDFESDPFAAGWTTESRAGLNTWAWGQSAGVGDDPDSAYSGANVVGMNLSSGNYALQSVSHLASPVVDVAGYDTVRLQYRRWLAVEDGRRDQARILANGAELWTNLATEDGFTHHTDFEWRFHDIDVSEAVQDGAVQIQFELSSDDAVQFGGWTIDDFCLVAYVCDAECQGIEPSAGCCDASAGPGPGGVTLWALSLLGLALVLRRRRWPLG